MWLQRQNTNYGKKQQIMKNEEIRNEWVEFIKDDRYKKEFISNEEVWRSNLEKLKEYIDRIGKKPSRSSKDVDIKRLGQWLSTQITNYNNKKQYIMKNEEIKNEFEDFINDVRYKKAFKNTKLT